jgi:hypothetical protein
LSGRLMVGAKKLREWQTQKLSSVVTEQLLNARVPAHDAGITIEEEHRIVLQVIDEQSEPFFRLANAVLLPVLVSPVETKLCHMESADEVNARNRPSHQLWWEVCPGIDWIANVLSGDQRERLGAKWALAR